MPPTPPVPVVEITTEPVTPVDMSLETGEDTRLEMAFSDELSYDEFGQNARFTYMYNGVLHANVSAVLHGGDWRIVGDEETIIDVLHWEGTSRHGVTALIIGRHDWKLIAITYGEDYQLKPQDLIGLKVQISSVDVGSAIITGEPTPFIYNGYLLTLQYNSSQQSATIKFVNCNPAVDNKCTWYDYDMTLGYETLTSYACQNEPLDFNDEIRNFLVDVVGLQPGQIQNVSIDGYSAQVPLPIGAVEV